ncbi:MAG: DNA-binding response OmpR family regulator/tRNA A-37 threonylcarbamoyl transferase component Bud32, partial [Bradymonadia bacterium]
LNVMCFTLDVWPRESGCARVPAPEICQIGNSVSIRVLVIEDNLGDARLAGLHLERASFEFEPTFAGTLEDGLAALRARPFAAVLLDLHLPDGEGIELVRTVCEAAVIVLTGLDDDQVGIEAMGEGAQDYLTKDDISPKRLGRTIRHAVERASAAAQVNDQLRQETRCAPCGALMGSSAAICPSCGSGTVTRAVEARRANATSRVGEIAHDRFNVVALLDAGSAGAVYRALDTTTGATVALKIIHGWVERQLDRRQRFLDEGRAQMTLRHPHLLKVLEVVEAPPATLVMEFVRGTTLATLMTASDAPRTPAEVVALLAPICHALTYVHSEGIVHRDIKPENILISRGPSGAMHAKLGDFGVANLGASTLTQEGAMIGSLHYMAPEQLTDASNVGPEADVYGFACTLYAALTRRPPFEADKEFSLMTAHLKKEAPSARSLNPLISPALSDAIAVALQKSPADRYASIAAFSRAIAAAVSKG